MKFEKIKGTQTEKNLHAALAGESMARNKYTFYALAARKEGHEEIADAFERMAKNEMMHAKFWFEALNGPCAATNENLQEAARGEFAEWHSMYPNFAKQAREDGLEDMAVMFERVAAIESDHERQFMTMFMKLTGRTTALQTEPEQKTTTKVLKQGYRCDFCGAVFETRPDVCEVCQAIGAFQPCTFEAEV